MGRFAIALLLAALSPNVRIFQRSLIGLLESVHRSGTSDRVSSERCFGGQCELRIRCDGNVTAVVWLRELEPHRVEVRIENAEFSFTSIDRCRDDLFAELNPPPEGHRVVDEIFTPHREPTPTLAWHIDLLLGAASGQNATLDYDGITTDGRYTMQLDGMFTLG